MVNLDAYSLIAAVYAHVIYEFTCKSCSCQLVSYQMPRSNPVISFV